MKELTAYVTANGSRTFGELAHAIDGHRTGAPPELVCSLRSGGVTAGEFADAAGHALSGAERPFQRASGAFATPLALARWLVDTVGGRRRGTVLDPACGPGHLLIAKALRDGVGRPTDWYGWDLSEACVYATRIGLWLVAGRVGRVADFINIRRRDALLEAEGLQVDTVLANPPFVSIRRLSRSWGHDYVASLRSRFPDLRGGFDLYVPFVLEIFRHLGGRGRFGIILPATVWSAAYAAPARRTLSTALQRVHRFAQRSLFAGAAVTPHIVVGGLGSDGLVQLFNSRLEGQSVTSRPEGEATRHAVRDGHLPFEGSRAGADTLVLGDVARVSAGTPGYDAHRIAEGLREMSDIGTTDALPFVVSRCIDPYRLVAGPLRFIKRRFSRPVLPVDLLTPGKRRLFERPKILVAGVCRRLEAARDSRGLAMGVGVYAVVPERIEPELILALLNSDAISSWYRRQFMGRELSGGYFGVNCSHLREIPVPRAWIRESTDRTEIVELVRRREDPDEAEAYDEIDARIEARIRAALGVELD